MIWEIIGISAATLTTFSFMPQIIKVLKNKSIKDVSIITLFQFGIGVTLWAIYGIHLKNMIIIMANIISLATIIIMIFLYFNYGFKKPKEDKCQ
ncbi:MAG: SemiSWEET family transporter [Candidatus Omnitrophota bacterium]